MAINPRRVGSWRRACALGAGVVGLAVAGLTLALTTADAGLGSGSSPASRAVSSDDYNLPRQFSSEQGRDGWYYFYGNSTSALTQAVWSTQIAPWGTVDWSSWTGAPRYFYIGARPAGDWKAQSSASAQMIQTGEGSDAVVGWKAPKAGAVYFSGMLNAGMPNPSCCDAYPDDGVWLSVWKGGSRLTGEAHTFHGTTAATRVPNAFVTGQTSVAAGDMLYFYARRGAWQDADFAYYSFTVTYDAQGDVMPPAVTGAVSGGKLTISATDDRSGVAVIEYLPPATGAVWTRYTGPVTVTAGNYLYRALDNAGNLSPYRQTEGTDGGITTTGGGTTTTTGGTTTTTTTTTGGGTTTTGGGTTTTGGGTCSVRVTFWKVEAIASCFRQQDGKWVSDGQIKINGLEIVPVGSTQIILDPDERRLSTSGPVKIKLGDVTLYEGTLNFKLDIPNFQFSVSGEGKIKGFPLTGTADVSIVDGGVEIDAEVGLPEIPGVKGGLTAAVTLRGTNEKGLELDKLSLELGELPIRGLVVKGAKLSYERTADGKDRWSGEATAVLPIGTPVEVTAGMSFLYPPLEIESVKAAVGSINKVIYGPIFLQKIGIEITFVPGLKVAGSVTLSAGPEVNDETAASVDGTLEIALPVGSEPVTVTASGVLHLVKLDLAEGKIVWKVPGTVAFSGTIGYSISSLGLQATASGWITSSSFDAEASGTAYVDALGSRWNLAGANMIVSNLGLAACGSVDLGLWDVSIGFGWYWRDKSPSIKSSGCGIDAYRPEPPPTTVSSAAPVVARQVSVPPGQSQVLIGATGTDAPPTVSLTSPSGLRIDFSKGGNGRAGRMEYLIVQEPQTKSTYFLVAHPEAGTWKVNLEPGSPSPITQVGSAHALPSPQVSAKVRRTKGRYALVWKLRAIDGQVVSFREITPRSVHLIATTTKKSGTVQFVPVNDGSRGPRKIEAYVEQRGLPRDQFVVATFKGSAPRALHRPAPISFTRRGTKVIARWRPVAGVARYELLVTVSDGRREFHTFAPGTRSLTIPRVSRKERVVVKLTAVGRNGLRSPARTSILTPKPVAR